MISALRGVRAIADFKAPIRCLSINFKFQSPKPQEKSEWSQLMTEAEKIVGYPTSVLNLRWLLNDEVANIAVHIKKLIGIDHPFIHTARNLLTQSDIPKWGLIVLLLSKAAGLDLSVSDDIKNRDCAAGIIHSQRMLAEITEMLKNSSEFHKSILQLKTTQKNYNDLNFGNKIALLSGDFLLSRSYKELALLRNWELNDMISAAYRDLTEYEFFGPRNRDNQQIPGKPLVSKGSVNIPCEYSSEALNMEGVLGNAKAEWTLRSLFGGGSLLAKSCQGCLLLAGLPRPLQEQGYLFGRNFALAWQAANEHGIFSDCDETYFSLVSAPVIFHLESDPEFYKELEGDVNFPLVKECVKKGPGLIKTKEVQIEYMEQSLKALEYFPPSEAKSSLVEIITAMRKL